MRNKKWMKIVYMFLVVLLISNVLPLGLVEKGYAASADASTTTLTVNGQTEGPVTAVEGEWVILNAMVTGAPSYTSCTPIMLPDESFLCMPGMTIFGGKVEFFDGAESLGSSKSIGPMIPSANLSINTLSVGMHTIKVKYSGFIGVIPGDPSESEYEVAASEGTIEVTIIPSSTTNVTGVTLDKETLSLTKGGVAGTLIATVAPANATNKNVTWSSNNNSVATVENGVVSPISEGTATITVTTDDGEFTATSVVTVESGGMAEDGTEANPYIITTAAQLNQVRENLSAYYQLGNDIDLSGYGAGYDEGKGWEPIVGFSGNFDGNGKTISNLFINRPNQDFIGLFSDSSGEIRNIRLEAANIKGQTHGGTLVGQNNGTISEASATGNAAGKLSVGGLVGFNFGSISKSNAAVNMESTQLPGELVGGVVGGLVGVNLGSIDKTYATGNIQGISNNFGGLVGLHSSGSISESYATGNVQGSILTIGGLVGDSSGTILSSYWDKETTGQATSSGSDSTFGKTTEEMKRQSTFTGWDFINTWNINEGVGYPTLRLQDDTGTSDTVAPILTAGTVKRISDETATVKFKSNEAGQYFYSIVASGEIAPTIDTTGAGEIATTEETMISLSNLASGAQDIYIKVKDASGNVSDALKIEIPAYINEEMTGNGSEANPYIIKTPEHLNKVREKLSAHYKLGNNLDLSGYGAGYDEGKGWEPIVGFSGNFNGNGKTISNLFINRPDEDLVGLFGRIYSANISNVDLRDIDIIGNNYVGGLVGKTEGGMFSFNSTISESSVTGSVTGIHDMVGGLVGWNTGGNISQSYSTAAVEGNQYVGGLVGYNNAFVEDSYAVGNVTGNNSVGGLVGDGTPNGVSSSYWDKETTGQVTSGGHAATFGKTTEEMKQQSTFTGWDFTNVWGMDSDKNDGYPYLLHISQPELYTVIFNTNGGSIVSNQMIEQGQKVTQPNAPTRAGYTFGGWYKETGLKNAWNFAIDLVTSNTTLYAKWNVYNVPSPSTPSTPAQPNVEEISVDVETGTAVTKTPVKRTVDPNGKIKDSVIFTNDKVKEAMDKLKEQKQDTAKIVIPDNEDKVSEVSVTVPKDSISTLATGKANLEIATANAHIFIPETSMQNFTDDLYFRVVPIKEATQKNVIEERAKKEALVQLVVGDNTVNVLGRPMEIETNMQSRPVTLTLPIPANITQEQLNNLAIFIEHSDGTKEVIQGKLVAFDKDTQGIQFTINKFSTFTILYMEGAAKYFSQTSCGVKVDCLQANKTIPVYVLENNRLKKVSEMSKGQSTAVQQAISPMLGLGGDIWLERTKAISYETPSKEMLRKNQLPAKERPKQIWKGLELHPGQIGIVTILQDTVIWESIDKKTKLPRILKKGEKYRVYRYVPGMYEIDDERYIVQDSNVVLIKK